MKKFTNKDLENLLQNADQDRVEAYMHMFDRVLLYTLATNLMPREALDSTVELWNKVVHKTIDLDATRRTNFLENSTVGRAAQLRKEPDGEQLRLHYLKQFQIAHDIITTNLHYNSKGLDDFEPDDFDSDDPE